MDKEKIREQELVNDGQSVFLFYDEDEGCYKAYGWSAYYADMIANGVLYYSYSLQMPIMVLSKRAIQDLRYNMTVVEHRPHEFYRFKTKVKIGDAGYERWMESIKCKA